MVQWTHNCKWVALILIVNMYIILVLLEYFAIVSKAFIMSPRPQPG